ncbi:MAG TPA: hypothetical protein VM733_15195 [Thermoanaerobaculia bacterium]|nr:hypothetical protein [Thermoanaerobaculia bacterium]
MRRIALIAAAAILVMQLMAAIGLAGRPLHYDENEYMHASWLMAAGKTIYRDFFEDHPPHLFLALHGVMPRGDVRAIDVHAWTIRARVMSGAFGMLAIAAVMVFSWRLAVGGWRSQAADNCQPPTANRQPGYSAPIVAAATLVTSAQIWSRGLADIRAEAPALALFWWGIVLLTWSLDRPWRAGAGIGLMFFATVWNPKWPLECALAGGYFVWLLWKTRRFESLIPASVISAVAVLPLFTVTNVRDYLFFNFQLKSEVVGDFTANPWIVRFFEQVPVWSSASPQHRWWWIVIAIAIGAIGIRVRRLAEPRLAWIALALAASALLEFRFIYPYPYLWAQYLVMIATSAALVYAVIAALLPERVQIVVLIAALIAAIVPLQRKAFSAEPSSWTRYWRMQRTLQTSLRAEDTVWISPPRHPVAAFDASYYWYNFRESTPSAIAAAKRHPEFLPPIGFNDLPPCAMNARYVEVGDWIPFLPNVCACVERNLPRLSPTPALGIFEVGAAPRTESWFARTRGLWSDLCRRQDVFLRGGQLNIGP